MLLKAPGIDINSVDKAGITALDAALRMGHTHVVEMLKKPGAAGREAIDGNVLAGEWWRPGDDGLSMTTWRASLHRTP